MRFSLLAAVTAFAITDAAQQSGPLLVSGVVLNHKTGEPVKRALLHISCAPVDQTVGIPEENQILTESSGRFQTELVKPGLCNFFAQTPGFTAVDSPQLEPFKITQSRSDLQFLLSPLGVITGKVTDEGGQPVPEVRIWVLTSNIVDGSRRIRRFREVSTDDPGSLVGGAEVQVSNGVI